MPLIEVIPLFGGVEIFGPAPTIIAVVEPVRDQRNMYPGINGFERLLMGSSGARLDVSGILVGDDLTYLGPQEQTWRNLQISSATATVLDTAGFTWLNCFVESYEPDEGIMPWIGDTGVSRRYRAVLRSLS